MKTTLNVIVIKMGIQMLILMSLVLNFSCTKPAPVPTRSGSNVISSQNSNGVGGGGSGGSNSGLRFEALAILEDNCASCHNLERADGGFGTILDVDAMIASGRYIIPGNGEGSLIVTRLAPQGNMPPSGEIAADDRQLLIDWINQINVDEVEPLSDSDHLKLIRRDLEVNVATSDRPTTRYFSLQVANNSGMNSDAKNEMKLALAKTINSLSRSSILVQPEPIDPDGLIFRVDLRDLAMDVSRYENVMNNFYPFSVAFQQLGNDPDLARLEDDDRFLRDEMESANYVVRLDWFNATSTLPILYKELLNLPNTQQELEAQLGVNLLQNINNDQVIRSGFRNSGVSSQNRIIERHVSANTNLPFWISYDFADNNEGEQNIFNFPLGPVGSGFEEKTFDHDGGEIIFQLPNGLFGYYLSVANGASIDKGPTNIVRQPDGPLQFFQSITNGLSCMSCHGNGLLFKKDDIRDFVAISQDFTDIEKEKVFNLYATEDELRSEMDRDNQAYFRALQTLGIQPAEADPINASFRYYNNNLFRSTVMAELGVDENTMLTILNTEPFKSAWVSILQNSGSITRQEFNALAGRALDVFKNGVSYTPPVLGDHLATPDCITADPLLMDVCTSPIE
ncbi:hypothetical protein [Pseudobacteriovorax antillogorgiicola]|uniref:Cytochrome c domain-containing protein n=1 Tax=Pseudobacteriovorax antillogorgiicola TaxID=1513793 RepID=A0A1Y6BL68_9BACT|nr:hypothetical protein [Pseudobacteriovorax antillogorgiicola]TCS54647.1 hypothetical protein EDD56_106160 [Pseudobacteriovorax antillogorgiicola]SMF16933.1 hypothetical protein SAMN06296036_10683 [Pseudobacteriovorax antillogorgiicola]